MQNNSKYLDSDTKIKCSDKFRVCKFIEERTIPFSWLWISVDFTPSISHNDTKRFTINPLEKKKKITRVLHMNLFFQMLFFKDKYKIRLINSHVNGDSRKRSTLERIKNIKYQRACDSFWTSQK